MRKTGSIRPHLYRWLIVCLCYLPYVPALSHPSTEDELLSLSLNELLDIVVVQLQPYRGDLALEALPQAISLIDGELLQTAGITSFQDALDYASAVSRQNDFGGLWDSFAIRGFAEDENLPSGYFVNGFSAGRGFSGRRDTVNIANIEVIKGAGAALYGRSEPGGTINIVTKKPKFTDKRSLRLTAADPSQIRAEGDLSKAVNTSLAFRINGSYENTETFRDTVNSTLSSLNPSLLYRLSDNAHFTYELELLEQKIPFDRGIVVLENNFSTIPSSRFLGEPADGSNIIQATGHQLTYQNTFSEHWNLLTGLGYRESLLKGYSSDAELFPSKQLFYSDQETLNRGRRYRDYNALDISGRVELRGKTTTGNYTHHILLGGDIVDYRLSQIQKRWAIDENSGDSTYSINIYNPIYGQDRPELSTFWDLEEKHNSVGFYAQDQIELNARWSTLFGVRLDNQNKEIGDFFAQTSSRENHRKTSPHMGVVFKATSIYSFFMSYASAFRPNSGTNASGVTFTPERSRSFDSGIKFQTNDGAISGNLSYFIAKKSNMLTADPDNAGYSLALGEAKSDGIDLDLSVRVQKNTTIKLAYAYVDAHTVKQPENNVSAQQLINIPMHKANVFFTHDFSVKKTHMLLGSSITYVSNRLGETGNSNYVLPSYVNCRVFGTITLMKSLSLQLNIENLFGSDYPLNSYSSLWTRPAPPRKMLLSINYQFHR